MDLSYKYHITKLKFSIEQIKLFEEEKKDTLNECIKRLSKEMGGPPELIIQFPGEDKPVYDTYIDSLLGELTKSMSKAIYSIREVVVYNYLIRYSKFYEDKNFSEFLINIYERELWEKIETSYIRISSTWDRIGQLLSFVYFNIRKYDRDGFLSTISQINTNIVPMYEKLRISESWIKVWKYSKGESLDGLKWLLMRRNLIIHQISLPDDNSEEEEEEIYNSYYNHLIDDTIKRKLKPLSKKEEINQLLFHLNWLVNNFEDIYTLCVIGLEKIPRIK